MYFKGLQLYELLPKVLKGGYIGLYRLPIIGLIKGKSEEYRKCRLWLTLIAKVWLAKGIKGLYEGLSRGHAYPGSCRNYVIVYRIGLFSQSGEPPGKEHGR